MSEKIPSSVASETLPESMLAPTPRYSRTGWALRFIACLHLAGAILIFFQPDESVEIFNFIQRLVKHFEPLPAPTEHFWLTIASAEMLLYGLLCFVISFQKRNNGILFALALAKSVTIAAFWYQFRTSTPYFAYIGGMAFDAVMAVWLILLTFLH